MAGAGIGGLRVIADPQSPDGVWLAGRTGAGLLRPRVIMYLISVVFQLWEARTSHMSTHVYYRVYSVEVQKQKST